MKTRMSVLWLPALALAQTLHAGVLTPSDITAPFAVQPFVGLEVTGGVTQPFFSDLSGLNFPGPGIVDILAGIEAFNSLGQQLTNFQVTGVMVMQSNRTFNPELDSFSVQTPITYTSTDNPLNQVTVFPNELNLAFTFNSDSSFQYSYVLDVTGVPNGGFLIYGDVEGARTPEPAGLFLVALPLAVLFVCVFGSGRVFRSRCNSVPI